MENLIEATLDKIVKEEYGGCDPRTDNPCILKARVRDKLIQAFCVGKWRYIGSAGSKYPPSRMMQRRAIATLRCNTGDTFKDRIIRFDWEEVTADVQISPSAEDVREHLRIMVSDTKSHATSLNWAIRRVMMALIAPDHELKERLMYILGNMVHWRHPKAKQVRNVFKQWIKEH